MHQTVDLSIAAVSSRAKLRISLSLLDHSGSNKSRLLFIEMYRPSSYLPFS